MSHRQPPLAVLVLALLALGGCVTPATLTERVQPVLASAGSLAKTSIVTGAMTGICVTADVVRFTATGVGNMVHGTVEGFSVLALEGGRLYHNPHAALVLGAAGGAIGAGSGLVKTLEQWRPGVTECLARDVADG